MGWVDDLAGKTVALDSAPLTYLIEQRQPYADLVRPFFQAVADRRSMIVASVVTLIEVLVHPLRSGNESLAQEYQDTRYFA